MPIYETPGFINYLSADVTVDTSTASTSFVNLLTINTIISSGTNLLCEFASCSLDTSGQILFNLTVDGTIRQSAATRLGTGSTTICPLIFIDEITGLSAGSHTIEINWAVTAGTANIRPVTQAAYEFASLTITQFIPLSFIPKASALIQTIELNITTDTTTNSTTMVALLSQSVTTTGGNLIVFFNANTSNTNTNTSIYFQIVVDSIVHEGGAVRYVNTPAINITLIDKITGLSSGAHTVTINWKTSANTARIRPVAAAGSESAQLTIMEVTN